MATVYSTRPQVELELFGIRYHELKGEGHIPKTICDIICFEKGIKKTSYYTILRTARLKGFVRDSFEETNNDRINRLRDLRKTKKTITMPKSAPIKVELEAAHIESGVNVTTPKENPIQLTIFQKVLKFLGFKN